METKDLFLPAILEGKVSHVAGASQGLARVMAQPLADAGSALILIARHEEEIDRTAKEIRHTGKKALAIKADLTKSDDIARVVEKAMSGLKKTDILVNNAGQNASSVYHRFEDIPETEWTRMIQTNVTGETIFLDGGMVVG